MPISPIRFLKRILNLEEQRANTQRIESLFSEPAFKFTDLLNIEIERDGEKAKPEFLPALEKKAADLRIDPVKVKVSKPDYIATLSDELTQSGFVINEALLEKDNEEAEASRKEFFKYARAVLTRDAFRRDSQAIQGSDLSEDIKEYAQAIHKKNIAINDNAIVTFIEKIHSDEVLLKVKSPGDGDCFYHSVMLDIIHDVLTHQIEENSTTAQHIKDNLLPKITQQMLEVGGPHLDFTDKTLYQSVILLLESAPIHQLPRNVKTAVVADSKLEDNVEIAAIKNSDIYHLLKDVCTPALRATMQEGAMKNKAEVMGTVKTVLQLEFSAYIKSNHGADLAIPANSIEVAKNAFTGGEFSGMPKERSAIILQPWNEAYEKAKSHVDYKASKESADVSRKEDFVNDLFEKWWDENKETAYANYMSLHTAPQVMAGRPQQLALSQQLHCNLNIVSSTSGESKPLDPDHVLEDATTLQFTGVGMHFNAVVGSLDFDKPTEAGQVLQERMQVLTQPVVTTVEYPWPLTIPETDVAHQEKKVESVELPPAMPIEMLEKTTEKTRQQIETFEITHPDQKEELKAFERDILTAASTGYKSAIQHTTFGKQADSIKSISAINNTLEKKAKQEADDLLYAIQLQDEEIQAYFRRFRK